MYKTQYISNIKYSTCKKKYSQDQKSLPSTFSDQKASSLFLCKVICSVRKVQTIQFYFDKIIFELNSIVWKY